MWPEIQQVQQHQRHELVLSGTEVSKRMKDNENRLDDHVYELSGINFLEISRTPLESLDDRISQLRNLTRLAVRENKLKELPIAVGQLTKLKILDVSNNQLTELPEIFGSLTELHSLNASVNQISKVASLENCGSLTYVDISFNKLEDFPGSLCSDKLSNLLDIKLQNNEIASVNPKIVLLQGLKQMDLSSNKLTILPKELAECPKLKELLLHNNPIKDPRLNKLTNQKPPKFKAVLDYIREHCESGVVAEAGDQVKTDGKTGKSKGKKKGAVSGSGDQSKPMIRLIPSENSTPMVIYKSAVQQIRPFIVCCILKNLALQRPEIMKKFNSLQTNLHDDICDKRTIATIATHDLDLLKGNLTYDCKPPKAIEILPLKRHKTVSAEELVDQLTAEADALRKEKKRNTFSGIHKYLNLLQDKTLYPFLSDEEGRVVSFPPITNSEQTKISSETKAVFVEVTSPKSLSVCKIVMEKLISECVKQNLIHTETQLSPTGEGDQETPSTVRAELIIQQVRVVDEDSGGLRVVFPSRVDLSFDDIEVERTET